LRDNAFNLEIFEKEKVEEPIFKHNKSNCIGSDIVGKRFIIYGGDDNYNDDENYGSSLTQIDLKDFLIKSLNLKDIYSVKALSDN